jgi:predicted nucleotidyltransferase
MNEESKHRKAFEEFAEEAQDELGESLKKLILYGSVARGDEKDGSDVDVFAVVESKEELEKLEDIAFDIGVMNYGVFISVQGQEEENFRQRKNHPFIKTVLGEGEAYV